MLYLVYVPSCWGTQLAGRIPLLLGLRSALSVDLSLGASQAKERHLLVFQVQSHRVVDHCTVAVSHRDRVDAIRPTNGTLVAEYVSQYSSRRSAHHKDVINKTRGIEERIQLGMLGMAVLEHQEVPVFSLRCAQ